MPKRAAYGGRKRAGKKSFDPVRQTARILPALLGNPCSRTRCNGGAITPRALDSVSIGEGQLDHRSLFRESLRFRTCGRPTAPGTGRCVSGTHEAGTHSWNVREYKC